MNGNLGTSLKEQLEIYQKIKKHFVGLPATLFAYSGGFRDVYILFKIDSKSFIWSEDRFFEYEMNLYDLYGHNRGEGIKKLIQSATIFEQILLD